MFGAAAYLTATQSLIEIALRVRGYKPRPDTRPQHVKDMEKLVRNMEKIVGMQESRAWLMEKMPMKEMEASRESLNKLRSKAIELGAFDPKYM